MGTNITGAHSIIFSKDAEADRAFVRDVLGLPHVDVGHGWLIFGLPPAELALHPSETNDGHGFYLMCDDIEAFREELRRRDVETSDVRDEGWGLLTQVPLPGGGRLGVYQPKHVRPPERGEAAPDSVSRRSKNVQPRGVTSYR